MAHLIRFLTHPLNLFPNEAFCFALDSATLVEISDEWEGGKTYFNFDS